MKFVYILVLFVVCWPLRAKTPNVVFILADDMGWMDSSLYGSDYYETPALEKMAENSAVFMNAYSASPLCSPSRASIFPRKRIREGSRSIQ